MGVEKETINLIALKKVYGACKHQALYILFCPGWHGRWCVFFRKGMVWTGGDNRMLWPNPAGEKHPACSAEGNKSLSSKSVFFLNAHFSFFHFRKRLL
jgi:hypothetical protein